MIIIISSSIAHAFTSLEKGWGCSSVGRASDRHAADAGSIPQCCRGFFSQRQLSVLTLLCCAYTKCAVTCMNICAHVKDPVVHIRVRWIVETLKYPAFTLDWIARLCPSWLFRGEATQIFHGEIPSGQYSCKKLKKKRKKLTMCLS